jgi:hypothetical protein
MSIKAIETRYKGYRFRSRLEARWAVFFDWLSMPWEYEPQGFAFSEGGLYLPDFLVTAPGRKGCNESREAWCEVKPKPFTPEERRLCELLVRHGQQSCFLLIGLPDAKPYEVITPTEDEHGQLCVTEALISSVRGRFWWAPSDADIECECIDSDQYQAAMCAARSARFEHGECG